MLEELKFKVNSNIGLVRRGHWVNTKFLLGIGKKDYLISIENGRIISISLRYLPTETGLFSIRATVSTWREHWRYMPKRNFHDLWSMLSKNLVEIDGDILLLMQNLQYFKDLISSIRGQKE